MMAQVDRFGKLIQMAQAGTYTKAELIRRLNQANAMGWLALGEYDGIMEQINTAFPE